ncbi:beta-catenin-like protein 1-like isoform 2 [Planoprotostelium fungivorum]|uniref:Beta-catenin-like protein 1-like isoform 2 n=1 Tax=Planoprotostelium fungivorum TaxID=1890364 RepID=A0A2P6MPC6_9EUKA|nr:beta-catenin-like protein 1-like isoform 2 [Planoprotostelium fungivorum]
MDYNGKRRFEEEEEDDHQSKRNRTYEDDEELDEEAILRMVEQAPNVEALDEAQVKKMLLSLEKKITNNQMLRNKFADKPEKFMDSEVELDDELKKMHLLATAPEFYPTIAGLGTITSIVSLFTHENTDSEVLTETKATAKLVDSFLENEGLENLIGNIERMDEDIPEEMKAVHNSLGIIENLIEVRPDISELVTEKTGIMQYLLKRISKEAFDDNKLYASEILAILVQESTENQRKLGKLNGMDSMLVALSQYRKDNPKDGTEEEVVENLFDALCSCLQEGTSRDLFMEAEGIELMLIMVKNKKFCRRPAIKVLNYTLTDNKANCNYFVDKLGLKTIFSAFMKKGSKKAKKGEDNAEDEHIVCCIVNLFRNLDDQSLERLHGKFTENNCEKVERLLELHEKYTEKLSKAEEELRAEMEEEEVDEEELYLKRLDAGLFTLQMIDTVIAYIFGIDATRKRAKDIIDLRGYPIETFKKVLFEYAQNAGDDSVGEDEPPNATRKLTRSLLKNFDL